MTVEEAIEGFKLDNILMNNGLLDVKEDGTVKRNELAVEALEKQIPYKLGKQDSDTGLCKCGVVTVIIDEPFYCKYCGQRLCK